MVGGCRIGGGLTHVFVHTVNIIFTLCILFINVDWEFIINAEILPGCGGFKVPYYSIGDLISILPLDLPV